MVLSPRLKKQCTHQCTPPHVLCVFFSPGLYLLPSSADAQVRLAAHDAWRSAPTVERRSAPAPDVTVAGATYKEGVEIFLSEDEVPGSPSSAESPSGASASIGIAWAAVDVCVCAALFFDRR